MRKLKIAISGKARSGKDTLSKLIIQNLGLSEGNVISYAFAIPLKETVLKLFPQASREDIYGPSEAREKIIPRAVDSDGNPLTYRRVLCDLGKLMRSYNPDCFVDIFEDRFRKQTNYDLFIVNDSRFINELNRLKSFGFLTVRIKRENHLNLNDISETAQESIPDSYFDMVIENNFGLDCLEKSAQEIANKIF